MLKIKLAVLSIFALIVITPVSSYAVTFGDAESVLNDYDNDISNLQKSIILFEQVIRESKDRDTIYNAYVGEARAYETMGDQPKLTNTSPLDDYEQGKAAAQLAIQINPTGAMGYYWYAGNSGREGEYRGVLNSLIGLPEFQKYLKKAYELDRTNADILEAYGETYYELPWIAGGSDKKALDFISRSLKSDPNLTLSMTIMGKIYIREGKYEQARKILMKAINYKTPTYRCDWAMFDKPLAQKLLDSIKDKK
jgi:tetratricopeptide (TPR) repeat protein